MKWFGQFFSFALANSFLLAFACCLLGILYPERTIGLASFGFSQGTYFFLYFCGNTFFLSLLLLVLLRLLLLFTRSELLTLSLAFVIDLCLLVYVFADTFVYAFYRTHINLAMLEMAFLGRGQIIDFNLPMILEIGVYVCICVVVSVLIVYLSQRLSRFKRSLYACLAVILLTFLSSNVLTAYSYATGKDAFASANEMIPLSQPPTMNKLFLKLGLVDQKTLDAKKEVVRGEGSDFFYPQHPMRCEGKEGVGYNILFVLVDSLRYDMLNSSVMPHLWEFSQKAQRFENFHSNGNNTRHGIFALFTGIPGTYWKKSLDTGTPAVLITALQQRGYEIGIFAGAPLNMPEFHRSIFTSIPNLEIWPKGESAVERDSNAIKNFEAWRNSLPRDKRFFGFIFLDNVHAYSFGKDVNFKPFEPYSDNFNPLKMKKGFDVTPLLNRYKNAAKYADQKISEIISYLQANDLLKNTIVVFSSDHGEEFDDNKMNFWGHGGNFSPAQTHIPFVVSWPGRTPEVFTETVSQMDIVPTLLPQVLGCSNPLSDYTVGQNIFDKTRKKKFFYATGWSQNAFVEKNRIVLINRARALEFLNLNQTASSDKGIPSYLAEAYEELSRFSKKPTHGPQSSKTTDR